MKSNTHGLCCSASSYLSATTLNPVTCLTVAAYCWKVAAQRSIVNVPTDPVHRSHCCGVESHSKQDSSLHAAVMNFSLTESLQNFREAVQDTSSVVKACGANICLHKYPPSPPPAPCIVYPWLIHSIYSLRSSSQSIPDIINSRLLPKGINI